MGEIVRFDTVSQYNAFNQHETVHPLVSVVDLSKAQPRRMTRVSGELYAILLKEVVCGDLRYGRQLYDYQVGTLVFFAPGQVVGMDNEGEYYQPQGYALVFHPDLLLGTSLKANMHSYSFFSYQVNEALHLSERERQIVLDCLAKINYELQQAIDKHSKRLIVANIELFLDYCTRFYERQFFTRDHVHQGILERFEALLTHYFVSDLPQTIGLPSVAYCAEKLNLSANYLGDLVKKETGKSAHEYIQSKLIDAAKEKVFDSGKTVSQIAHELGLRYPQHFTRLFKQRVGQSPNAYRRNIDVETLSE